MKRRLWKKLFGLIAAFTLVALPGCTNPTVPLQRILMISTSDELWWISPSGPYGDSRLGPIIPPSGFLVNVWDIAWNGIDSEVWAIASMGNELYKVRITDRRAIYVGWTGRTMNALAIDERGNLFGMGERSLFRLDKNNASSRRIEGITLPCPSSGDMAFVGEKLYATISCSPSRDSLVEIDLSALSLRIVGSIGYAEVYGLSKIGGDLYGFTGSGILLKIDPGTGQGQWLRQLPSGAYGAQSLRGNR